MDFANKVLAKCAANDPNFPRPSEAVRLAWAEHIGMTNLPLDDLLAGVTAVYGSQQSQSVSGFRMLPGHVMAAAKAIRQDRLQRSGQESEPSTDGPRDRWGYVDKSVPDDPDCPPEWTAAQRLDAYWAKINRLRDQQEYEQARNHPGSLLPKPPASAAHRAKVLATFANRQAGLPDDDPDEVPWVNVLAVTCGYCGVPAGERCVGRAGLPGQPAERLTTIPGHPTRIVKAAIAAGHSEASAEAIAAVWERRQFQIFKQASAGHAEARK
jgi:hypothetical protein